MIIRTRGRRFQQHACRTSRNTLSINCEDIYDPDQDVNLRSHVGWHHGILETLSKVGQVHPTSQQHPGVRHSAGGWQQSVGGPRVQVRPPQVSGTRICCLQVSQSSWLRRCSHPCIILEVGRDALRWCLPWLSRHGCELGTNSTFDPEHVKVGTITRQCEFKP